MILLYYCRFAGRTAKVPGFEGFPTMPFSSLTRVLRTQGCVISDGQRMVPKTNLPVNAESEQECLGVDVIVDDAYSIVATSITSSIEAWAAVEGS